MGGPASGRFGGRPTVKGCQSLVLDLDALMRARAGRSAFCIEMAGKRGSSFRIGLRMALDDVGGGTLTIVHDAFQHVTRPVPAGSYSFDLIGRPCRLGGHRWHITCPRTRLKVRKLYLPNGAARFACRQALGLAYRSQRIGQIGQTHAKQARAYAKLGAEYHHFRQAIPPRPKRMRIRTYARLVDELKTTQEAHQAIYTADLRRLLG